MSEQVSTPSDQEQPTLEELRALAAALGDQINTHLGELRGDGDD